MKPGIAFSSRLTARRSLIRPGLRAALALVALGALAAGCGFEPRGRISLGEAGGSLYLEAPVELRIEIESALSGSAVQRGHRREEADAVLLVDSEGFERRVVSVDPDDGSEREAEITYSVEFRIGRGGEGGAAAMDAQQVTLFRDFLTGPEALVAKEHEEDRIRAEMRREAAARILRRVAAAMANAPSS